MSLRSKLADYFGIFANKYYSQKSDEQLLGRLAEIVVESAYFADPGASAILHVMQTRLAADKNAHASLIPIAREVAALEQEKHPEGYSIGSLCGWLKSDLRQTYDQTHSRPPATDFSSLNL